MYNPKKNVYVHPQTKEEYHAFDTQEEFEERWQDELLSQEQKALDAFAQKTPIYKDTVTNKLFYSKAAVLEPHEIPRKKIETRKNPLLYDPDTDTYTHPETKEIYIEIPKMKEYPALKERIIAEERLRAMEEEIDRVDWTPIYQEGGKLYYPACSLLEEKVYERKVKKGCPLTGDLRDPETDELYFEVGSREEYQVKREEALRVQAEKEARRQAKRLAPIYVEEGFLYYPKSALLEKIELNRKKVPLVPKQMTYNKKEGAYTDSASGEKYVKVSSELEYQDLKVEALENQEKEKIESVARAKATETPIYRNDGEGKYYYPEIALQDPVEIPREIIPEDNQLKEFGNRWVQIDTKEIYIQVSDPEEFAQMQIETRAQLEALRPKKKRRLDIFEDSDCLYYPKEALQSDIERRVIKFGGQIVMNEEGSFVDLGGEKYLRVKNPEEWEKLKTKEEPLLIYHDRDQNKYYYPLEALTDSWDVVRKTVSFKNQVQKGRDEKYRDVITEAEYLLVDTPEEFLELKQGKQVKPKSPTSSVEEVPAEDKNTPVYKDEETGKLYYPEIALTESKVFSRDVLVLTDQLKALSGSESGKFLDTANERYVEVPNAEEFEKLRQALKVSSKVSAKEEETKVQSSVEVEAVKVAQRPVFRNPETGHLFYPEMALADSKFYSSEVLDLSDQLEPEGNKFRHVATKEVYIEVADAEEFEKLRAEKGAEVSEKSEESMKSGKLLPAANVELEKTKTKQTPIFQNQAGNFFYPEIALTESKAYSREVMALTDQLTPEGDKFVHAATNEPYIQVANPEEFEKLRANQVPPEVEVKPDESIKSVKVVSPSEVPATEVEVKPDIKSVMDARAAEVADAKTKAAETPVYRDVETGNLFYPEIALTESKVHYRDVIPLADQLKPEGTKFVHVDTNEKYFEVRNAEEFEKLALASLASPEADQRKVSSSEGPPKPDASIKSVKVVSALEVSAEKEQGEQAEQVEQPPSSQVPQGEVKLDESIKSVKGLSAAEVPDAKTKAAQTPVYRDVQTGNLFYPEIALTESKVHYRDVIPLDNQLKPEGDKFVHVDTNETYIEVENAKEFEKLALASLATPEVKPDQRKVSTSEVPPKSEPVKVLSAEEVALEEAKVEQTPIFRDQTGKLFYPEVALIESKVYSREVLALNDQLEPDGEGGQKFVHLTTKEEYIEVANAEEFEKLRSERLAHSEPSPSAVLVSQELDKVQKTPIYQDAETGRLFYPEVALTESKLYSRETLPLAGQLTFNPDTSQFIHTVTKEPYLKFRSEGEFIRQREVSKPFPLYQSQIIPEPSLQIVSAKKAPIFKDESTYYYPQIALTESKEYSRETLELSQELNYDEAAKKWIHQETGEIYVTFKNPLEFLAKKAELSKPKEAKELALETPIYHDPETGNYFYPLLATKEEELIPRQVISEFLSLYLFDDNLGEYRHPVNNEKYIQVTPEEFETLQNDTPKQNFEEIINQKVQAPIYQDEGGFYYPVDALVEITPRDRSIETAPEMVPVPETEFYLNLDRDNYVKVGSPEEFEALRSVKVQQRVEYKQKRLAQQTPIYKDPETGKHFYPRSMLVDSTEREIIEGKPPLEFDDKAKLFYKADTRESYLEVESPDEFESLKKRGTESSVKEVMAKLATELSLKVVSKEKPPTPGAAEGKTGGAEQSYKEVAAVEPSLKVILDQKEQPSPVTGGKENLDLSQRFVGHPLGFCLEIFSFMNFLLNSNAPGVPENQKKTSVTSN